MQIFQVCKNQFNYAPKTTVNQGVKKFVDWYISYVLMDKNRGKTKVLAF